VKQASLSQSGSASGSDVTSVSSSRRGGGVEGGRRSRDGWKSDFRLAMEGRSSSMGMASARDSDHLVRENANTDDVTDDVLALRETVVEAEKRYQAMQRERREAAQQIRYSLYEFNIMRIYHFIFYRQIRATIERIAGMESERKELEADIEMVVARFVISVDALG
jgi:hypothetical protein